MDPLGELKKLYELHQSGALDAAEYDTMKSALLLQLLHPTHQPPSSTPAPQSPAPTQVTETPSAPRELNASNDPVMTVLGYLFSPMTCLGTIFAIVNLARGNNHGLMQLVLNIVGWFVWYVVYFNITK